VTITNTGTSSIRLFHIRSSDLHRHKQKTVVENEEAKLTKWAQQFSIPLETKMVTNKADHVMLNLCRESQGCRFFFSLPQIIKGEKKMASILNRGCICSTQF
jgi:hypothetical protein